MADHRLPDRLAAAVLARALADGIHPERAAHDAPIGDALLAPLTRRTIEVLAARGYRIVAATPTAT